MKKKILLPTDFSKNAWNALKYASELYKNEAVDFYLLNAFLINTYSTDDLITSHLEVNKFNEAERLSKKELLKLMTKIEMLSVPSHHTYHTYSELNSPLEAVKNFVEKKDIDLVIISNKGETDAIDVLIGTNSIDIMEKVRNCPVFLIPSGTVFKEPNEIVFPTSFKTHYKRRELSHLYEVSKITNAPVRILHAGTEENLTKEQQEKRVLLEECFDGISYTFHFLENGDVQKGLNLFTQSRNSEMISFINKKHTFFGNLFSRPMVKELGFNTKVPVLVLHDLRN